MSDRHAADVSVPLAPRSRASVLAAPVGPPADRPGGHAAEAYPAETRTAAPRGGPGARGVFVPLLLVTLAVLGWALFETVALRAAHLSLVQTLQAQQPQVVQARRVSRALSALAGDTQRLAEAGDPGARLIVAQLQKRGITIHPSGGQGGALP